MSYPWNRKLVEMLIDLIQDQENIYNTAHPDYLNRVKRINSLKIISDQLKKYNKAITPELVSKKLKNLRTQYAKELRDITLAKKNSMCTSDERQPRLWCFEELSFLKNHIALKLRSSDFEDSDDTSIKSEQKYDEKIQSSTQVRSRKQVNFSRKIAEICSTLDSKINQKYSWLGKQVVFEINKIRCEEIQEQTAWTIQRILQDNIKKDREWRKAPMHINLDHDYEADTDDNMETCIEYDPEQSQSLDIRTRTPKTIIGTIYPTSIKKLKEEK